MLKSGMKAALAVSMFFHSCLFATTGVSTVTIGLDQTPVASRWQYDPSIKVTGSALTKLMAEAKKGLIANDRAQCLSALSKSFGLGKSLGPWLSWNELQCAKIKDKKGNVSIEALRAAIKRVDANPTWLVVGPWREMLKSAYSSSYLVLAERQVKVDRRAAWKTIDRIQQLSDTLTRDERADLYRWAGELAFIEQNLLVAQSFLQRSLNERDNPELRDRIQSVRSALLGAKEGSKVAAKEVAKTTTSSDLGISDNEREIYERMNRSYESQDFVSAIEDGVELVQKYPGSRRAIEASDRVLDIYLSVAAKTDEKFIHVRETVMRQMLKVDAGRLSRWAANAYARGHYLDALNLAEKSYDRYDGHPDSTKTLLLAGKAALACGENDSAERNLSELLKKHGGTIEAVEANFRLGLLQYRKKKWAQAAAYFERLLALGNADDFEYRALYWQWRSQQKVDLEKSAVFAQPLMDKYPLSYYGLRAQAELNKDGIQLVKESTKNMKAEYRLLESERLAWERLGVLLSAGWIYEAEKEIEELPSPQSAEERLVRAKLWAAVFRYEYAISNYNKAIEERPELAQTNVLRIIFPEEFSRLIKKEAKAFQVDENWVRSLMRQESAFRPDARSSSNALGLMQLLPATAQEVAADFKMKNLTIPESLFDPDINVRLGTAYMTRMIRGFSGNIPLGLAAYNAGPGRLRKWLSARKNIEPLEKLQSSSPDVEIWIDELPWAETSFYVKSILRNWIIYRLLNEPKVSLGEPIWVDGSSKAR